MFLIRTSIRPSSIHGNGVFASEDVAAGTTIWRYEPAFDILITDEQLSATPAAFREYIDMYAYRSSDLNGRLLLPCDHAKFLNHSPDPNTSELPFVSIASRRIRLGEEITCDYSKFCINWTGFD